LSSVYDIGAMGATNLLSLASRNPALLKGWAQRMVAGVIKDNYYGRTDGRPLGIWDASRSP
jgi:hypothetical protein